MSVSDPFNYQAKSGMKCKNFALNQHLTRYREFDFKVISNIAIYVTSNSMPRQNPIINSSLLKTYLLVCSLWKLINSSYLSPSY